MSNSIGWEKAVLGTAIFSPELVEQAEFLLPSDFTGCHAGIWSHIMALYRRDTLELRTLVEELRSASELDHISAFDGTAVGETYIAELVASRGMAMSEFAAHVLNASGKRMLNREAALIAADARDENITYEQALDNAESRFISMRRRTTALEGASLGDLFGVFIPRMEGMRAGTIQPRWSPETLAVREIFPYVEDDDYVIVAARPGLRPDNHGGQQNDVGSNGFLDRPLKVAMQEQRGQPGRFHVDLSGRSLDVYAVIEPGVQIIAQPKKAAGRQLSGGPNHFDLRSVLGYMPYRFIVGQALPRNVFDV